MVPNGSGGLRSAVTSFPSRCRDAPIDFTRRSFGALTLWRLLDFHKLELKMRRRVSSGSNSSCFPPPACLRPGGGFRGTLGVGTPAHGGCGFSLKADYTHIAF